MTDRRVDGKSNGVTGRRTAAAATTSDNDDDGARDARRPSASNPKIANKHMIGGFPWAVRGLGKG